MEVDAGKTEQELAAEKAAVKNLREVHANMSKAFSRIGSLESALGQALTTMREMKKYIPESAYAYSSTETLHARIEKRIIDLRAVLEASGA